MVAYTVKTTEKTQGFSECVFLDTLSGVYVEQPGDGFYKHPSFTSETLKNHLKTLKKEGFRISKKTSVCKGGL